MRFPFSPAAFTSVYCIAYVVVLAKDFALFRYYPQVGEWVWGWDRLADSGPQMSWYGLMANAALPALLAGILCARLTVTARWRAFAWVPPVFAMAACLYLMRIFF